MAEAYVRGSLGFPNPSDAAGKIAAALSRGWPIRQARLTLNFKSTVRAVVEQSLVCILVPNSEVAKMHLKR